MVNTNNSTPQPHTAVVSPQQSSTVATSMTSPTQIPSPSQSSPFPVTVIAQHDFPGTGEDEISFQKGEIIAVIAKDDGFGDGWWTGRNAQNQIGLFPAIYTTTHQPSTPRPVEVQPLSPKSPPSQLYRAFSSESEGGVYEGLGIHSDQLYAVNSTLDHTDSALSDVEEAVAELSIQSSASSVISSPLTAEIFASEDDESSIASGPTSPILQQIRHWSPTDVAAFIADRGFPNQAPNFIHHEITGAILLELDLAMLKELDIAAFGIRFSIMREIEGLKKLGAPHKKTNRHRDGGIRLPARSPSRAESGDDDTEPLPPLNSTVARQQFMSPVPQFSNSKSKHVRQSSYEPTTPRSPASPRPHSMSMSNNNRLSSAGTWEGQRFSPYATKNGHQSSLSQDSGFGGSNPNTPDIDNGSNDPRRSHIRSKSTGMENTVQGRIRVDSQDSGIGHSRHTSVDTVIKSPVSNGHKRQSSSIATVRAQPPSIPLMEAVGAKSPKTSDGKALPAVPKSGTVTLPGTRSETPTLKPKFLFAPNSTRSPVMEQGKNGENGVRLVKSYSALRRRSSSTTSPTPMDEPAVTDLHHHRSTLLKNISAKDASVSADFSGWLKKRTERGSSIPGINVGPGVGMVGGWKRRWFVLKGRRLSYYHSEKDTKEKGVIDITAHRCVTSVASPNPSNSPTDSAGPARKISLTGSSKYIFKVVPPAPGTSRAVTFTPQKVHIFSAENEAEFRGWVEALMKANIGLDANASVITSYTAPTISLAKAKEMKSRPPALDLSSSSLVSPSLTSNSSSFLLNSDGGVKKASKGDTSDSGASKPINNVSKNQPLPNPLAAKADEGTGNFEAEMDRAFSGHTAAKSPEIDKQPVLELSIPIGLN